MFLLGYELYRKKDYFYVHSDCRQNVKGHGGRRHERRDRNNNHKFTKAPHPLKKSLNYDEVVPIMTYGPISNFSI